MNASARSVAVIAPESGVNDVLTAHLRAPASFSPALKSAGFSLTLKRLADEIRVPELARGPRPVGVEDHISELLARLKKGPVLDSPELITVRGVFYPAVLMTPGIWDRPDPGEGTAEIQWRTPLQDWLFSGFEEWAPSWDLNTPDGHTDRPLFGQLGHEDEAFSLLVLVTGPGAGLLREKLLGAAEMVCNVELRCWLIHRSHAGAMVPRRMRTWGKTFDYCLLVDLTQGHRIERYDADEPYSGYLWECVAPKEWLGGKGVPELVDSFFVWEHTDFASPQARDYGLDALAHKHAYIEERFGELELIQKSAPIVPGKSLLATESFYAVVEHGPA
jgi:hypothetical protein